MSPPLPLLTVEVRFEQDLVLARQRARQIASLLGFDAQEQTRIATAVSEVVRNAFKVAGNSKVEFSVAGLPQAFQAVITPWRHGEAIAAQQGNGFAPVAIGLPEAQAGREGLIAAKRLVDDVQVETRAGRAIVLLTRQLPRHLPAVTPAQLLQIGDELARQSFQDPYIEIQQQNQELLRTLEELRQRQEELAQLNQELEDTNRGVLALYAELNEKAESLQRASELKTRFLSNISHEFRTPLYAVLSLSQMLLSRMDGDLTQEQEKQVSLIRKSAESLADLVNDLLDLAKVESGKVELRIAPVEVQEIFSALRGMMRPLLNPNMAVTLVFEDASRLPLLQTDEGKVSQILRNLVSNALKYTEQGEVRIGAYAAAGNTAAGNSSLEGQSSSPEGVIVFTVSDTGIGIEPADQQRIFEEFVQVEHRLQQRIKGTGLGLPLCKKLAELMGGRIDLESKPGIGSTFSVTLPLQLGTAPGKSKPCVPYPEPDSDLQAAPTLPTILLIDDDEVFRYTIRRYLGTACRLIEAEDGSMGLELAQTVQPKAILLDLMMPEMTGFEVIQALQQNLATRSIPVIIMTSKMLTEAEQQELRQAAAVLPKLGSRVDNLAAMTAQEERLLDPAAVQETAPLRLQAALRQVGVDLPHV